jgi:hypothetical protein
MNIYGILGIVGCIAGFAWAAWWLQGKSRAYRWSACLVSSLAAIPSVLFAVYYLHIFPDSAWFYTLRSWCGSELLATFLGVAAGAWSRVLPSWLRLFLLFASMAAATAPYVKMIFFPLPPDQLKDRWSGDACLQSSSSTCGAASTASILRFLGMPGSEREIAGAAFSTDRGTEAWYLARHLRSRGLVAHFDFRPTYDPAAGTPAIVGVRFGEIGHFIAVLSATADSVTYVDPLNGRHVVSLTEFLARYHFSGFHLVVQSQTKR